jgi:hypothetical protein
MALETSDPDAVRAAARDILSQQAYTSHELTWWRQLLYYLAHPWAALTDGIDYVLGALVGGGAGAVVAWIFVVALIAGAVFLIVGVTRTTVHDNVIPVGLAPSTRFRSAAEFLAEAEQAERDGRWRQAIRMRYSALLAELGAAGLVRLRPGRTTGEYLMEVRGNLPAAAESFFDATMVFERAWYGTGQTDERDLSRFKDAASGVNAKAAA